MTMMNTEAPQTIHPSKLAGSVFGLAAGDAIGYVTEFRKYPELRGNVGVPDRLRVSDDTQLSLAVWEALDAWDERSLGTLRAELIASFRAWYVEQDDPRWSRAPGGACLSACAAMGRNGQGRWELSAGASSAGCGSVMRAPWIGLHSKVADDNVVEIAAMQAVLTHAPAENVAAAVSAAVLTRDLARGMIAPGDMVDALELLADDLERREYPEAALGQIWRHAKTTGYGSPFVPSGYKTAPEYWADVADHVRVIAAFAANTADGLEAAEGPWEVDPCAFGGEGWRASECLAVAVGILESQLYAPTDVLIRAAETNGDSDSIGAVAGGLAGAAFGNTWPRSWRAKLEPRYLVELDAVVAEV